MPILNLFVHRKIRSPRKVTHQAAGLVLAFVCHKAGCPVEMSCGVVFGATAPDWLELPFWINGERLAVIPHRTLTHWLTFWILALVVLVSQPASPGALLFQGFALGCVLHIMLDAMTPMGVPVFWPTYRIRIPPTYCALILALVSYGVVAGREVLMGVVGAGA